MRPTLFLRVTLPIMACQSRLPPEQYRKSTQSAPIETGADSGCANIVVTGNFEGTGKIPFVPGMTVQGVVDKAGRTHRAKVIAVERDDGYLVKSPRAEELAQFVLEPCDIVRALDDGVF